MDLNEAFENARQKELEKQLNDESMSCRYFISCDRTTVQEMCVGCYFDPCRCGNSLGWLETLSSGV